MRINVNKSPASPKKKRAELDASDPWNLLPDLFKPSRSRRRLRYEMSLQRMPGNEPLSQKEIAAKVQVDAKNLVYYLDNDPKRPGALSLYQRQSVAEIACGSRLCEPWLSEGHWFAPDNSQILPSWLITMKMIDAAMRTGYWTALAHLRLLALGRGGNGQILSYGLPGSPWGNFHKQWPALKFPKDNRFPCGVSIVLYYYTALLPEMALLPLEERRQFIKTLSYLYQDGTTDDQIWKFDPVQVHKAMAAVPVTTQIQRDAWKSLAEGLAELLKIDPTISQKPILFTLHWPSLESKPMPSP